MRQMTSQDVAKKTLSLLIYMPSWLFWPYVAALEFTLKVFVFV